MSVKSFKNVYTIVENPNGGRNFWVWIVAAFTNSDSSLNVQINALPV